MIFKDKFFCGIILNFMLKKIHKSKTFDVSQTQMEEFEYVTPFLLEGQVFWTLKKHDHSGIHKTIANKNIPECDMFHLKLKNLE